MSSIQIGRASVSSSDSLFGLSDDYMKGSVGSECSLFSRHNSIDSRFFWDSSVESATASNATRPPSLVDGLLNEIYSRFGGGGAGDEDNVFKDYTTTFNDVCSPSKPQSFRYDETYYGSGGSPDSDGLTEYSTTSDCCRTSYYHGGDTKFYEEKSRAKQRENRLREKGIGELRQVTRRLETQIQYCMSQLTRQVKKRDRLRYRRERQYNLITAILQATSQKRSQDTRIRFSLEPSGGDPGFNQWKDAMKMVARLPKGVPVDFRKTLWLTLSDKYLSSRQVDWTRVEKFCFNEWSNPDDDELGMQIVRDLHRTGCSLFCGEDGMANQLMLKRVLLAYARWNKAIGYCQGFNMLAAIILEVMEKSEHDALKVMIFLIEGILPECYFANNMRGLSVDMAVFRDLLKMRLPRLSQHLDNLQKAGSSPGNVFEPPLTNVYTMQWFLTLFSTCLPRETVLRVWDLVLLEGNEVLLRTALAIWKRLEERIIPVDTADEFYCLMGHLSQEMLAYKAADSNKLIRTLVAISPFPFTEVEELREKYTFNITPWSHGIAVAKKGWKILYSDDEDNIDEDEEKIAVAATFGMSAIFKSPGKNGNKSGFFANSLPSSGKSCNGGANGPSQQNVDKERLTVDISALKQQYRKLRQRQKQAQIIFTTAMVNQPPKPSPKHPNVAMNHLLLGKKPIVSAKPRRGPPPGAVPEPRKPRTSGHYRNNEERRLSHYPRSYGHGCDGSTNKPIKLLCACPQPQLVSSGMKSNPEEPKTGKTSSTNGEVSGFQGDDRPDAIQPPDNAVAEPASSSCADESDVNETGLDSAAEIIEKQVAGGNGLDLDVWPERADGEAFGKMRVSNNVNGSPLTVCLNQHDDREAGASSNGGERDDENEGDLEEELLMNFDNSVRVDNVSYFSDASAFAKVEATPVIKENLETPTITARNKGDSCYQVLEQRAHGSEAKKNVPARATITTKAIDRSPQSVALETARGMLQSVNEGAKSLPFNPFPNRLKPRRTNGVGIKLGMYPSKG